MSEIQLKDTVYNDEYYDSSEDEDDDNFEGLNYDDYDSADEDDEDMGEFLQELLEDVASVDVLGHKAFKIDFIDSKVEKFLDKDEDCDFDTNYNGFPVMPDGGEEFFLPYMKAISKKKRYFKDAIFETNVRGQRFTLE